MGANSTRKYTVTHVSHVMGLLIIIYGMNQEEYNFILLLMKLYFGTFLQLDTFIMAFNRINKLKYTELWSDSDDRNPEQFYLFLLITHGAVLYDPNSSRWHNCICSD